MGKFGTTTTRYRDVLPWSFGSTHRRTRDTHPGPQTSTGGTLGIPRYRALMSNDAISQNELVSSSDDPASGGSSSRQRRRQRLFTSRGKKRRVGDFACACLQLAHGERVRVAGRHDQSLRFLLFVFRSAHLGTMVRLILMQIRFKASDFGQIANINIVRENRNGLLVRNRMRRWCSGHLPICSCRSAVKPLDAENSSQRRLLLCLRPEETH